MRGSLLCRSVHSNEANLMCWCGCVRALNYREAHVQARRWSSLFEVYHTFERNCSASQATSVGDVALHLPGL